MKQVLKKGRVKVMFGEMCYTCNSRSAHEHFELDADKPDVQHWLKEIIAKLLQ